MECYSTVTKINHAISAIWMELEDGNKYRMISLICI